MVYDLHIHINPHAAEGEIYEYDTYAKMLHLDYVGFVTHYTPSMPEKLLRDFRDIISTFTSNALAGVELHYPIKKVPRGFDYYILHFSNIMLDADILNRFHSMIIAHPFAYGMQISESLIPLFNKNELAIEYNSAHYKNSMREFYNACKEQGIQITFGSDAHSPSEMGEGFDYASRYITPFRELKVVRGYLHE